MSSLYILDINYQSDVWFANIFSPFHRLPFLIAYYKLLLRCSEAFHLIQTHLFSLCFLCFCCHIENIIVKTQVKKFFFFFSMFSSGSFMVSWFAFKFLIHFELISVYGGRQQPSFIRFHVVIQFLQHELLKRLSFPIVYFRFLCHTLIDLILVGFFLGSLLCSILGR